MSRRGLRTLAALLPLVLAAVLAPTAGAQSQSARQTITASFTTTVPGAPSGYRLGIDYHDPENPDGKPPSVQEVVISTPPGTVIDTSVPARCEAPDPVLMVLGEGACPPGSQVGRGRLVLHTGLAPLDDDVVLLNAEDELILLTRPAGSPLPVSLVTRAQVRDGKVVTSVPPIPGLPPPDTFTAIDLVELDLDEVTDGERAYIRTPPDCPDGSWTTSIALTYRDGVTQTVDASSPCSVPAPPASAPAEQQDACLPAALRFRSPGLGPVRLGQQAAAIVRRAGPPTRRARGSLRYCVEGGGQVHLGISKHGDARLIATTARRHSGRGTRPGSGLRSLRRAHPRARRIGRGLISAGGSSRVVFGVRRGRVRFVALAERAQIRRPAKLRYYLSRAGLR